MTGQDAVAGPSEEQIRAHLARAWTKHHAVGWPEDSWVTGWNDYASSAATLYDLDDIRDSELERLDELVADAIGPIRDQARRDFTEALVGAMLAYAAEHPDTPRAVTAPDRDGAER